MSQLELVIDLEASNEHLAKQWVDESIAAGEYAPWEWDYAYETAWMKIEDGSMFQ